MFNKKSVNFFKNGLLMNFFYFIGEKIRTSQEFFLRYHHFIFIIIIIVRNSVLIDCVGIVSSKILTLAPLLLSTFESLGDFLQILKMYAYISELAEFLIQKDIHTFRLQFHHLVFLTAIQNI